jgi:hypothetical protein
MRNVADKSCGGNQNTQCSVPYFFPKIVPFMWSCGKILYSGAGRRWQYGACALRAGYLRLQIHTLRLCNTPYFFIATMVTRKRLYFTLHEHCFFFFVQIPSSCKKCYECCTGFIFCGMWRWTRALHPRRHETPTVPLWRRQAMQAGVNTGRFVGDILINWTYEIVFSRWTFLESYDSAWKAIFSVFMNSFYF